jgi:hypothetical protein
MLQLYHDENKLHFEEMMLMMFTFTRPLRLAYIFLSTSSLTQQSMEQHATPVAHIILILLQ